MLRELTWEQFRHWQYYFELEPFGERLKDFRAASIVAALYNINRDTKKHPEPFPLQDFVLDFGEQEEKKPVVRQTWKQMKDIAKLFVNAFNSKR